MCAHEMNPAPGPLQVRGKSARAAMVWCNCSAAACFDRKHAARPSHGFVVPILQGMKAVLAGE